MRRPTRKIAAALAFAAASALALAGCASPQSDTGGTEEDQAAQLPAKVVIDTTSSTGANEIAKVGGFFEERFGGLGVEVEYTQLGTSSQMLEGIASGNLDFTDIGYPGLPTGAAAGVDFRVIGAASSGGGDIVVAAPDGPETVADLKGKRVAAAKGSSGWALLVRALADAGLTTGDLELIDLKPDEAQNAFLSDQVDAWAIWGGQAGGLDDTNSRVVISGEELGLIPGAIVTSGANAENDAVLEAYLGARQEAIDWYAEDPEAVVAAIAADRDLDPALVTSFFEFSAPLNEPVSDALLAEYQSVADLFFAEGEISREVQIAPLLAEDAFQRAGLR